MKKRNAANKIAAIIFIALSCAYTYSDCALSFEGADGSSMENAIVIRSVGSYLDSIRQEADHLNEKYGFGSWEIIEQHIVYENKKYYDKVRVRAKIEYEEKIIYFDVTEPCLELDRQFTPKE